MTYSVVFSVATATEEPMSPIQTIQTLVTGREVTGDPGEPVVALAQFYPKFIRSL
jgi:hypothetical protein